VKYLIYTPIFLLIVSCASRNKIEISANPDGAEVFVSDKFLGEYKSVGKTPTVLDFKKTKIKGKFVHLSVKSENFQPYNVVIPKDYSSGKMKVKLSPMGDGDQSRKLASVSEDYEKKLDAIKYSHTREIQALNDQLKIARMMALNQSKIFDEERRRFSKETEERTKKNVQRIFNKTFEIQNALQNKRLSKAGKALAELKAMDPPDTLFLTLEGNFEFLNGRRSKALASYKRALVLDPTNLELVSIVRQLERASNG